MTDDQAQSDQLPAPRPALGQEQWLAPQQGQPAPATPINAPVAALPATPTPQDQPRQDDQPRARAITGVGPGPEDVPPEKSFPDFLTNHLIPSGINFITNTVDAVTHAPRTIDDMGALLAGGVKAVARSAGMELPENRADEVARAFANYAKARWFSGPDQIWEHLYNDPVGMASDFSMVAGAAGGVAKLAALGGEAGGMERLAQVARTVSEKAGTAANVTNLAWYPGALAKGAGAVVSRLLPKKAELPAFDPSTAEFEGGLPGDFDLKTKTFEPPSRFTVGSAPKPAPPPTEPDLQPAIAQRAYDLAKLRQGEGITLPGWEEWRQADQDIRAKPPKPPEAPEAPAAKAPPAAAPAPASAPAKSAWNAKTIGGMLAGAGLTGTALDLLTHHVLQSVGAGAMAGVALKYLPGLLRSDAGQAMLARLGPNSSAATAAAVARDMIPALNSLHQSQQPIVVDPARAQQLPPALQAKGGPVNDELARLQRERLPLRAGTLRDLTRA